MKSHGLVSYIIESPAPYVNASHIPVGALREAPLPFSSKPFAPHHHPTQSENVLRTSGLPCIERTTMNKKVEKSTKRSASSSKRGASKARADRTSKTKRERKQQKSPDTALLALIANPPALTRCSETCPHIPGCSHARALSGNTCPIEAKRYADTVTSLLGYCTARGAELNFLLLRSVADIAAITVQIERAERYAVERGFFYVQTKKTEDPDMVKLQIQPIVDQINRLYERRRRDIRDIEKHLTQTAGKRRSPEEQQGLSLAQTMAEFLQKAKPLLYASLAPNDGEKTLLEKWTYPGDTPEEAERCRREAQRILALLNKKGCA